MFFGLRERNKMTEYYPIDEAEVLQLAETVITKFPAEFSHITMEDIHWVFKEAAKSPWQALTVRIWGPYKTLTPKPIMIIIHKENWDELPESKRALLIYHELSHIIIDEKSGEFKLLRHDIQDFAKILEKYGILWENSDKFLELLK
jgi:predicted metallopeptidase